MEFLENLTFWQWGIAALVLIIIEMLAPGAFFLWLGIAAAVVGVVMYFAPDISWQLQFSIFAVVSIVSLVVWHRVLKKNPTETDQPKLNRRGEQYVGRTFTLSEPIVNGQGKIRVDDSTWKIEGKDCDSGSKIEITGVDGVMLRVKVLS
jgi:membrane protein implicated in regulation of membrane protease activity